MAELVASIQTSRSLPSLLRLSIYLLRVRKRVIVKSSFCRWARATDTGTEQLPLVGGCLNYASRKSCYDSAATGAGEHQISAFEHQHPLDKHESPIFADSVPDQQPLPSRRTSTNAGYPLVMWPMPHTCLSFSLSFLL